MLNQYLLNSLSDIDVSPMYVFVMSSVTLLDGFKGNSLSPEEIS